MRNQMLKANERLNQPVLYHGNRTGHIDDFWLDSSLQHIMGITVRRGWSSDRWTIPYAAIYEWQKHGVSTGLPTELDDTAHLLSFRSLRQQPVIIDGQPHGRIADIMFDADGNVLGISAARFGRFGTYIFTPESVKIADALSSEIVVDTKHHLLAA